MIPLFVIAYTATAFLFPAITVGTTPIPLGYCLAAGYCAIAQPRIPDRQLKMFIVAAVYLAVVAARNASDDGGDVRDFMYVFICFGQMVTFCVIYDLFERGQGDFLLGAMVVGATANLALMILQFINPFGIDQSLRFLWAIPWELVRRDDYITQHVDDVVGRPYGLMAGFNVASMSLYLVFRANWVRYGAIRSRVASLLALFVSAARMLTAFFFVYELIVPLFLPGRRKGAITFAITGTLLGAAFFYLAAQYGGGSFFLKFAGEIAKSGLSHNYSYTNRLESYEMAIRNIDKIFLFGGIHSNDFLYLTRAFDSELLLRSLQFGWLGFVLLVLMLYYYFDQYRSYDGMFLLFLMLWTSVTFTGASNFEFTPFLLLYGFVCRDKYLRQHREPQSVAAVPYSTLSTAAT